MSRTLEDDNFGWTPKLGVIVFAGSAVLAGLCAGAASAGPAYAHITFGSDSAAELVDESGFDNPEIIDTRFLLSTQIGCDEMFQVGYKVKAIDSGTSKPVEVVVCRTTDKPASIATVTPIEYSFDVREDVLPPTSDR